MERRLQVTPRSPAARLFAEDHGRLASVKKTIRISPKNVGIEPMNWQNMGYFKTWPSYLENSMRYLVHVIGETKINTHTLGRPWSQTVGGNPSSLIFFPNKGDLHWNLCPSKMRMKNRDGEVFSDQPNCTDWFYSHWGGSKVKTLGPTDCSSYWQTLMTWPFPYRHVSVAWIPS